MISAHQPTIFGASVIAAISSKADGTMKFETGGEPAIVKNRQAFLKSVGVDPKETTLVGVTYETEDFAKYRIVDEDEKGIGIENRDNVIAADALVTHNPRHALFLPLADCVGAVLYDEEHHALMVSHLGRHSTEMQGAKKSVEFLRNQYGTNVARLKVWLSPGVGKASYPLVSFHGQSLHEVIESQLEAAGVLRENIENGHIDTAESDDYYSHSQFLKGNGEHGRFAVIAMMREQGEPAS
jgi:copper oxidase (laccase) domain-containing protein